MRILALFLVFCFGLGVPVSVSAASPSSLTLSRASSNSVEAITPSHDSVIFSYMDRFQPVVSRYGMVAAQEQLAAQVGVDILKQGGNAFDAAVAVGFALAVTLPRAGNLGGGGFLIGYRANDQNVFSLDYRETAPALSSSNMFLDSQGNVDTNLSQRSLLASGVPGTVHGLTRLLQDYGTLSLSEVMAPAIRLAKDGFPMTADMAYSLRFFSSLAKIPSTKAAFFKPNGEVYEVGEIFRQPDLAATLQAIASSGPDAFYKGDISKKIVDYMAANGGIITQADLAAYTSVYRQPVRGSFHDVDVVSMGPPSSGGIHIIQILNMLESIQLKKLGHNTPESIHLMAEAMKRAYADRSAYLGDPDFVTVPQTELLSKKYAYQLIRQFNYKKPTPVSQIKPGSFQGFRESHETTHFSIVDRWGNAVSNTYTLNFSYGNGHVVAGAGFFLNNEMDDFTAKPGAVNAFGLVGGELNAIQPGKRMLSSMAPTMLFKGNQLYMVTGTPGGSRIITTLVQLILNTVVFDMSIAEATQAVRIHHQLFPDEIRIEKGLPDWVVKDLEKMGYTVTQKWAMGSTQSIVIQDGLLFGSSDLRKPGGAVIGY